MIKKLLLSVIVFISIPVISQTEPSSIQVSELRREHLLMDFNWTFSLGHASDVEKDFFSGTSYFTYLAKTGYGDGPSSPDFDDRAWRKLNLPHDWAVELPFSGEASHSHGYKTIGWKYPENSVGWYRKSFHVPASDLGRRISIQFDGIFRNSEVWVNGFYLGHEQSGYIGFEYDITDYLNYGSDNVIAVRADASTEEGWFYEGAGIYRHVWLNKTASLHVSQNGIFASSEIADKQAVITIRSTIKNDGKLAEEFKIEQQIVDTQYNIVASEANDVGRLQACMEKTYYSKILVNNPKLWSPDSPYLYKLLTRISFNGRVVDETETVLGIRSIRFDAKEGFFLNGKPLKIVGSNNHQNHAGVGSAIPDALQEFRIKRLKEMGSNAYRCSHYPPTPELLDACDRLGMLVLVENRLMGVNTEHFDLLKRVIMRDRNHPSVIAWSLGNEEWAIESNIKGARITETMQRYAQTLDSTRRFTVAVSGGCGNGSSQTVDVMGFNYLAQCDIDEYHRKFPNQAGWGTEETSGCGTRGFYEYNKAEGRMAQFDRTGGVSIERGWKFYDERPWLGGLFYWTGFDYKGEPNPLAWPAVSSQFGIMDDCGFAKDPYYYLKSWWGSEPVLHIFPHWNWKGMEGKDISVWAYSNCDEVELLLNKKSLGRKTMPKNGHIEWIVPYTPGVLLARGFKNGKEIITSQVETTGEPASVQLIPNKATIEANGEDVAIITVQVNDKSGLLQPTAENEISFSIEGPAKIIGVGNGDPQSHEPDCFCEAILTSKITDLKELTLTQLSDWPAIESTATDTNWRPAFKSTRKDDWMIYTDTLLAVRGQFEISNISEQSLVNLFTKSILDGQSIYVNGHLLASAIMGNNSNQSFTLDHKILKNGENTIVCVGKKFRKRYQWDVHNTDPGIVQIIVPAETWKRKAFNGLAQVIVQSTKQGGDVTIKASSKGLTPAAIKIVSRQVNARPSVE